MFSFLLAFAFQHELAAAGKCTDARDQKLLDNEDTDEMIDKCLDTTEDDDGFIGCMVKDGFTKGCAGCFMDDINCQWDKCAVCDKCETDYCPACDKCLEDKCDPSFLTCSGLEFESLSLRASAPVFFGGAKGKCMDAQDQELLDDDDTSDDQIDQCLESTDEDQEFIACMVKDGYTRGCAGCFMDDINCQWDKCPVCDKCETDDCPACDKCMEDKCDDSFITCSGLEEFLSLRATAPASFGSGNLAAAEGKCMDAQDMQLLDDEDTSDDQIDQCLESTDDDKAFIACLVKDGYTRGCAGCFMDDINCQWDKCPVCDKCEDDDCPECDKCMEDKCDDSFVACSGLEEFMSLRASAPTSKVLRSQGQTWSSF